MQGAQQKKPFVLPKKDELIDEIKNMSDDIEHVSLNLIKCDFQAVEKDVEKAFPQFHFIKIKKYNPGSFQVIFQTKIDAINFIRTTGDKKILTRKFFIKMGRQQKEIAEKWAAVGYVPKQFKQPIRKGKSQTEKEEEKEKTEGKTEENQIAVTGEKVVNTVSVEKKVEPVKEVKEQHKPAPKIEKAPELKVESKPIEQKPQKKVYEAKHAENKQVEQKKPVEQKPNEKAKQIKQAQKPAENKPVSQKPVEHKPVEQKAAEQKPTNQKPAEHKPAENKPAEHKFVEKKPAEQKPVEKKPAEQKPAEQKTTEKKPAEQKPAESKKQTESKVAESKKPAESKPVEKPAVEAKKEQNAEDDEWIVVPTSKKGKRK